MAPEVTGIRLRAPVANLLFSVLFSSAFFCFLLFWTLPQFAGL